ncbi:unnamed protein product (macronuclear) [Paramecium tetraurelia]|uniref:PEGA domain-containing protein n=1 Tax=Paramecium tetraurelia TaxID=5888 RepID=A0C674_PARTE|nr:uncharacterized protein GSPATT00035420001 [Paramecium tetraurelia]CAK66291.1 unnamed protein product [Paramecium tetraurelia]|eukprot:XP_001433688.1 hypothetical protein (macronuclear) [Paramecium tetraurelia strain d4-2]
MKQTRVQSAATNSRLRDNHYDPKVHAKAWIAPGIFNQLPKYEHLDSGLVVIHQKNNKMKQFKELSELNEEIQEMQKKDEFRKFKEFENLYNGDLVVTIEYCTNCSQHAGSTRHDEEKYYTFATNLKQELIQQYPTAKVYLKPLIYDPHDYSIDTLYIQRRIGAFEVQVCSKNRDQVKKGLVFSKLNTKIWPNYTEVIERVSDYLNTAPLEIYVNFGENIKGNLNNIEVTLTPYRQDRPQSSVSRISSQTKKTNRTATKERKIIAKTNNQGYIKLEDVPVDVYVVEVHESNDYLNEQLLLNMVEMAEQSNDTMQVVIKLRKQTHSYLDIKIFSQQGATLTEAKITITNLQTQESMLSREIEPGRYEAILEPNQYTFTIQKRGYKELSQTIDAVQGVNEFKLIMEVDPNDQQPIKPPQSAKQLQPIQKPSSARPTSASRSQQGNNTAQSQQQMSKQQQSQQQQQQQQQQLPPKPKSQQQSIQSYEQPEYMEPTKQEAISNPNRPISGYKSTQVFIYDPYTNLPIEGVQVILNEESTKQSQTYVTDQEGTCRIILQGVLEGKMVIQTEGYFPIVEEYGTTQSKMNLYQLRELSFPLIQHLEDKNSVMILVQTNVEVMPIDIKMILPDNVQIDQSHQNVLYDMNDESGCQRIIVHDLNTRRGVYRIIADIIEPDYVHPQHLKVYIITNKDLKLVDVPKTINQEQIYWDLGVICAPNSGFLEINTPTDEILKRDKYLKDYQSLLQFLKNSKNMDLKTILGFNDKERLELQGDVFVQKEKIKNTLDKYGFEAITNLDYLIYSAMMSNGLYSFKRLEQKFGNLDFEFIFDDENSTSKQKEMSEDEPYDDDYDI